MSKEKEKKGLPAPLAILGALVLALVLELAGFNWKAVATLGRTWTPLPEPKTEADEVGDSYRVSVFYYDLHQEIDWCHFEVEVRDKEGELIPADVIVGVSDEGDSKVYQAGQFSSFPGHDKGSWFPLHTYGKVTHLTLQILTKESGCVCTVRNAEINGGVPFRISVPRIAGLFVLLTLLWFLRPGSAVWDNRRWNRRPWTKLVCVALVLLLNLGLLFGLVKTDRLFLSDFDNPYLEQHLQYPKLARALAEGRTWIEVEDNEARLELLQQVSNPYDRSGRNKVIRAAGYISPWDTAYYNGKLYVYFGVVPVLCTYLPYYLLTGRDLPTWAAVWLSFVLILTGAFLFLRALLRRSFPETPFPAYVLLAVLLGNCTGILFYALEPSFYVLPITFSLGLALSALALWLSAARRWEFRLKAAPALRDPALLCFGPERASAHPGIGPRIVLGSLLAALTAGCRPQFLVFSALALPIFLPLIRQEKGRGVVLKRAAAFCLPYAAVAIPLMYYNYIRFGSPFDFGANYNLTTNDMTRRGFHLARLPDGLFAYLFRLPKVELSFPYIKEAATTPVYMGKTVAEPMFGGVFLVFPFLWTLLGTKRVSPLLRAKKLRGLVILPLVLALVVVIADTEMAGILWRYTGDFLPLLFLAAILVWLALLQTANTRFRRTLLRFLVVTTLLGLLTCLLISVTSGGLLDRDPENYYRLKDFLSVV